MSGNGSEQMPGEAVATKTTTALHFVWIKGLCHKITDLSEQEPGRDLSRCQSGLDSRPQPGTFIVRAMQKGQPMLLKDHAALKCKSKVELAPQNMTDWPHCKKRIMETTRHREWANI